MDQGSHSCVKTKQQKNDVVVLSSKFTGLAMEFHAIIELDPKLARILCIIDSFDAMTTERPYQPTKTLEEALEEIERCAGTQFDPVYAAKFVAFVREHYLPLAEMQQLN